MSRYLIWTRIIAVLLVTIIVILQVCSCDPVKRVKRDPVKFEQIAKEVIRRGYCVNDTVITTRTKDSVVYNDRVIHDSVLVPVHATNCNLDVTTPDGIRVIVKDGVLHLSGTIHDIDTLHTSFITNTVRDRKREDVLFGDLGIARDSLNRAQLAAGKSKNEKEHAQNMLTRANLKLAGLIAIIALYFIWKVYRAIRRSIPHIPFTPL